MGQSAVVELLKLDSFKKLIFKTVKYQLGTIR